MPKASSTPSPANTVYTHPFNPYFVPLKITKSTTSNFLKAIQNGMVVTVYSNCMVVIVAASKLSFEN